MNDTANSHAKKFISLAESLNLSQHVNLPTHRGGNTLDLVLTSDDLAISDVTSSHTLSPDHFTVSFALNVQSPGATVKDLQFRRLKSIDIQQFKSDITSKFVPPSVSGDIDDCSHPGCV